MLAGPLGCSTTGTAASDASTSAWGDSQRKPFRGGSVASTQKLCLCTMPPFAVTSAVPVPRSRNASTVAAKACETGLFQGPPAKHRPPQVVSARWVSMPNALAASCTAEGKQE